MSDRAVFLLKYVLVWHIYPQSSQSESLTLFPHVTGILTALLLNESDLRVRETKKDGSRYYEALEIQR